MIKMWHKKGFTFLAPQEEVKKRLSEGHALLPDQEISVYKADGSGIENVSPEFFVRNLGLNPLKQVDIAKRQSIEESDSFSTGAAALGSSFASGATAGASDWLLRKTGEATGAELEEFAKLTQDKHPLLSKAGNLAGTLYTFVRAGLKLNPAFTKAGEATVKGVAHAFGKAVPKGAFGKAGAFATGLAAEGATLFSGYDVVQRATSKEGLDIAEVPEIIAKNIGLTVAVGLFGGAIAKGAGALGRGTKRVIDKITPETKFKPVEGMTKAETIEMADTLRNFGFNQKTIDSMKGDPKRTFDYLKDLRKDAAAELKIKKLDDVGDAALLKQSEKRVKDATQDLVNVRKTLDKVSNDNIKLIRGSSKEASSRGKLLKDANERHYSAKFAEQEERYLAQINYLNKMPDLNKIPTPLTQFPEYDKLLKQYASLLKKDYRLSKELSSLKNSSEVKGKGLVGKRIRDNIRTLEADDIILNKKIIEIEKSIKEDRLVFKKQGLLKDDPYEKLLEAKKGMDYFAKKRANISQKFSYDLKKGQDFKGMINADNIMGEVRKIVKDHRGISNLDREGVVAKVASLLENGGLTISRGKNIKPQNFVSYRGVEDLRGALSDLYKESISVVAGNTSKQRLINRLYNYSTNLENQMAKKVLGDKQYKSFIKSKKAFEVNSPFYEHFKLKEQVRLFGVDSLSAAQKTIFDSQQLLYIGIGGLYSAGANPFVASTGGALLFQSVKEGARGARIYAGQFPFKKSFAQRIARGVTGGLESLNKGIDKTIRFNKKFLSRVDKWGTDAYWSLEYSAQGTELRKRDRRKMLEKPKKEALDEAKEKMGIPKGASTEKLIEAVQQASGDMDSFLEAVETPVNAIRAEGFDDIGDEVLRSSLAMKEVITQLAPKPTFRNAMDYENPKYTKKQLKQFEEDMVPLMRPDVTLQDQLDGGYNPEHLKLVKAFYPQFYNRFVMNLMGSIQKMKRPLNNAEKMRVYRLTGFSPDNSVSPESISISSQLMAKDNQQKSIAQDRLNKKIDMKSKLKAIRTQTERGEQWG